jgi:hypothetical protein
MHGSGQKNWKALGIGRNYRLARKIGRQQMLATGGLEVYADGQRAADEDDPRGYYEHKNATQLQHNTAWVAIRAARQ